MKNSYKIFVTELKSIYPGQYYKMAKRMEAVDKQSQGDIIIECLDGLPPEVQVEKLQSLLQLYQILYFKGGWSSI